MTFSTLFAQVTFLVTHINDPRIVNLDVRDILLQSISVLVQYRDHLIAFERNQAAREGMVGSLLASFDNRFWISVSNILLRFCKGSGFGALKASSNGKSLSPYFQVGELLASFKLRNVYMVEWICVGAIFSLLM